MIERLLTTEQVAGILQVHPFTVLKFIKQGKLSGIKIGRGYRIQESVLQQFLEERMAGHQGKESKAQLEKKIAEATQTHEIEDDKKILRLEGEEGGHYYVI